MLRGWVLLAVVGLVGCEFPGGRQAGRSAPAAGRPPARLGDRTDVNLADWLKKPRSELAQLVAEWSDTVQQQRRHAAENPLSLDLLPGLQPPGTMPVFGQAPSPRRPASACRPTQGRRSGRRRGAPPGPARRSRRPPLSSPIPPTRTSFIASTPGAPTAIIRWNGRSWPRLAFQSAEWKLATGEAQAAADLVQMHKQLRSLLDDKAAAGPLGAALLPLGRRALAEAAAAWKKSENEQTGSRA